MSTIKEKIESSPVIWMLGILLIGFLSGVGTYDAALRIMNLETISKDRLKVLEQGFSTRGEPVVQQQESLPSYLGKKEIDGLFEKVRYAFNNRNISEAYSMLGPIARSQYSEKAIEVSMTHLFNMLGKIESGFYVSHSFTGKQGLYKNFVLSYFAKYERAERGAVTITIIDDGTSFQIYGVQFNRM